jgi:hypothetical protein
MTKVETQGFLERHRARTLLSEMKRHAAFGVAISTVAIGVGAWRYFFVVGANDTFWLGCMIAGVAGMLVARVFPAAWSLPEKYASRLLQKAGSLLFLLLLSMLYFAVVTPVGMAMRRRLGGAPARWSGRPPEVGTVWVPKGRGAARAQPAARRSLFRNAMDVMSYFHSNGHYVLMPFIVIVLSLGLLLFFVKSSALAPFIYTLF